MWLLSLRIRYQNISKVTFDTNVQVNNLPVHLLEQTQNGELKQQCNELYIPDRPCGVLGRYCLFHFLIVHLYRCHMYRHGHNELEIQHDICTKLPENFDGVKIKVGLY